MYEREKILTSNCPILTDIHQYPTFDEVELHSMESKFLTDDNNELICMYPKVFDGYIDIHVFDGGMENGSHRRIVLKPGYRLAPDEENYFMECCHSKYLRIAYDDIWELYDGLKSDFSAYNCKYRHIDEYRQALEHFYIVSHPCEGAKSVLYRCGYPYLAYSMNDMNFLNLDGTTPEEILGLPCYILDAFNKEEMKNIIRTKEDRKLVISIFEKYDEYIEYPPSRSQWFYLTELFFANREDECDFNAELYASLAGYSADVSLDKYTNYYNLKRMMAGYYRYPGVPNPYDIDLQVRTLVEMANHRNNEKIYDIIFENCAKNSPLSYEDDKYFAREVLNYREFCVETSSFYGEPFGFFEQVMEQPDTHFVIIHKKENTDKPYAYLYFYQGEFVGGNRYFYAPWSLSDIQFLEDYFINKKLDYADLIAHLCDCINNMRFIGSSVSPEGVEYLRIKKGDEEWFI